MTKINVINVINVINEKLLNFDWIFNFFDFDIEHIGIDEFFTTNL